MNQKLKKIMILSGTYIVLMTVLLIGVSTAKFTDSTVAYSSFGAAGFNVILLGKDKTTGADIGPNGTVEQFGKTLLAGDLLPGMKYATESNANTAKQLPFKVANGTCESDVSQIAVDYTVKLRTTRNLPLAYKLVYGSKVYEAIGPYALDKDGNRVQSGTPQLDANGIAWYEWYFCGYTMTDDTVLPEPDPVFSLSAGTVSSNDHSILIEWPITVDANGLSSNSDTYMKEIELLEVRIVASQQNNTTAAPTGTVEGLDPRTYTRGLILLDPEQEVQTYEVDYSAFLKEGDDYIYEFDVDNGVSVGTVQPDSTVRYKVSVLAPMLWQGESGTGSINYTYGLSRQLRKEEQTETSGTSESYDRMPADVFVMNLEDGTRTQKAAGEDYTEDLKACSAAESKRLYFKEQHYSTAGTNTEKIFELANTETVESVTASVSASDSFRLVLGGTGGSALPAYLTRNGKLKIVIEKAE